MKQDAAKAIADEQAGQADPLETPEQRQLRELAEQQAKLREELERRDQTEAQRQAEAEAKAYADHFMSTLEAATEGASDAVVQLIGQNASGLLANDTSGQLTPEKAIEMAVAQAKAVGVQWGQSAPAAQPGPVPPVSSSHGIPPTQNGKLPPADTPEGRSAREAAMLAVAAEMAAQPD